MLNATMYFVYNCVHIETTKALRVALGWLASIEVFPYNTRLSNMPFVMFLLCGWAFGLILTHSYALFSNIMNGIIVRKMFWGILNYGIVFVKYDYELHWIGMWGGPHSDATKYKEQNMLGFRQHFLSIIFNLLSFQSVLPLSCHQHTFQLQFKFKYIIKSVRTLRILFLFWSIRMEMEMAMASEILAVKN